MGNRWLQDHGRPLIIAHRGASQDAPENTMAAFELAHAQGADGIELDVYMSHDEIPVVIHDMTLSRTTNGKGLVKDHALSDLQQLDAGNRERIPTLASVLNRFPGHFLFNIEIKPQPGRPELAVAELIAQTDCADRVCISSFDPMIMRRVRDVVPAGVLLAQLRFFGLQRFSFLRFKGHADHPYHKMVTAASMKWALSRGQRVHAWTVDDLKEGDRLRALGVHGLVTNVPQRFVDHWSAQSATDK